LGYPQAALCGVCLALVAYNTVAVVMAAWRSVHGANGPAHMKEYTCGRKFPLTSPNPSRPAKSISKADFFPKT
jgi:hypothetical protein